MINVDDPRFGLIGTSTTTGVNPANHTAPQSPECPQNAAADAFNQIVRDVIRPEIEDNGAELARRGYEYEIVIEPGQRITMRICPPVQEQPARSGACPLTVRFSPDAGGTAIHIARSEARADGNEDTTAILTVPADRFTRFAVATLLRAVIEARVPDPWADGAAIE